MPQQVLKQSDGIAQPVLLNSVYPNNATAITASSGNVANASAAGVAVANTPLIVEFPVPIPASTTNTAIVVTCPALGSGNTNNTTVAHGFQL